VNSWTKFWYRFAAAGRSAAAYFDTNSGTGQSGFEFDLIPNQTTLPESRTEI